MTWKEFKDRLEEIGVEDSSRIEYLDVDGYTGITLVTFTLEDNSFWVQ